MVDKEKLDKLSQEWFDQSESELNKLLLFGSYSKGKYNRYSDVDLLIISKDFKTIPVLDRNYPLYFLWDVDKDIDFLCYTPEEAKRHSQAPTICKTALEEGIKI